jgi:hypothetical protein
LIAWISAVTCASVSVKSICFGISATLPQIAL